MHDAIQNVVYVYNIDSAGRVLSKLLQKYAKTLLYYL